MSDYGLATDVSDLIEEFGNEVAVGTTTIKAIVDSSPLTMTRYFGNSIIDLPGKPTLFITTPNYAAMVPQGERLIYRDIAYQQERQTEDVYGDTVLQVVILAIEANT